jgi:hypothetical protein
VISDEEPMGAAPQAARSKPQAGEGMARGDREWGGASVLNPRSESQTSEAGSWARDAEARRRAGHADQARRLAEAGLVDEPHDFAGRAVLALACLELGDVEGARRALEPAVAGLSSVAREALDAGPSLENEPFAVQSDPLEDLAENELEHAFAQVESEAVEIWTTNRVAEAALRSVEEGRPEGVAPLGEPASPFATETVATLLERQGDPVRARAIRRTLEREVEAASEVPEERKRWIGTLERWLENLRRASR